MPKVVLVTGASSGLGRAIAAHLAREGYTVFGTSRRPADQMDGFTMLALDVTSDESAAACVRAVLERAGRLDVLVNNAGADLPGTVEEIPLEDAKWLFETNFWGVVRMVKAALPQMRAQGGGQIINISSAMGRIGLPIETYYASSKHALEGFTASLRHEVKPFNIHVSIIEPGFFRSNIRSIERPTPRMAIYDHQREAITRQFDHAVKYGADPERLARLVARLIEMDAPGLRYPILPEAHGIALATRFLPYQMFEDGIRVFYGLDDWRDSARRYGLWAVLGLALLALVGLRRRE